MLDIPPVQYVDDILVYGFDRARVKEAGRRLWRLLEQDGWLCSPQSQLEPSTVIDWMGKTLDGQAWSLQSSAGYVAGMVNMWIKLATLGYCQKTLRRLLGKLVWANCPSRETSPHTSGPLAWMMWGPQNAKYTPPKVPKAPHDDRAVDGEQPIGGQGGTHVHGRSGMEVYIHGGGMGR